MGLFFPFLIFVIISHSYSSLPFLSTLYVCNFDLRPLLPLTPDWAPLFSLPFSFFLFVCCSLLFYSFPLIIYQTPPLAGAVPNPHRYQHTAFIKKFYRLWYFSFYNFNKIMLEEIFDDKFIYGRIWQRIF